MPGIAQKGRDMKLRRKVYDQLIQWKEQSQGTTAVLVEGARRIGKSTVIEEFARNEYDDYLLLDFARETDAVKRNFENIGDIETFFRNLFLLKGRTLKGNRCAIIFDEVQMCLAARQAIKYLVADGRYDYLETGSLISIKKNVKDIVIPSEEHRIAMYPLDFEEFLWALGDDVTAPAIIGAFNNRQPLGEAVHRSIMDKLRKYMAVGGMPQSVMAYIENKTYEQIDAIKRSIVNLYYEDLKKYDDDNREKASVIFKTISEQLHNHNSHFRMSKVDKNARYRNYNDAIEFIAESRIGNECINVTDPEIALGAFADRSNFKMYMGDTGLLVTQMMSSKSITDENLYKALIFNKLGINQGIIMENLVAQMMKANGHELYFHEFKCANEDRTTEPNNKTQDKTYEIDFLTVANRKLNIIEVKSSSYKQHTSFDKFRQKCQVKINEQYILYTKDLAEKDGVLYLPIYMAMCL